MAAAMWVEVGRGKRSAGEAAPPIFEFKNKAFATCTSNACFRSSTGSSTCSLVGSSLEPAAGFKSPSASTRPREVGV